MQNDKYTTARFLLSRTDSIGDVILTLPMAGFIKRLFPQAKVIFLGRSYTKDIVTLSEHVDEFLNYDELEKLAKPDAIAKMKQSKIDVCIHVFPKNEIAYLAKDAGIPTRVGTRNRFYHWVTCNKLIALSRKHSPYHEAQLNIRLLSFLSENSAVALAEIASLYGFTKLPQLNNDNAALVATDKIKVILHPKSKGSAREWGLQNFKSLIQILPAHHTQVYISGTAEDGVAMKSFLEEVKVFPHVSDITGKMNLQQFIAFISHCDSLVAASTGPLHISAALGKKAIGLFSSRRPIHPGRWAPLGAQAIALVNDPNCKICGAGKDCDCISKINPERVAQLILK